jgi:hypothetical protein
MTTKSCLADQFQLVPVLQPKGWISMVLIDGVELARLMVGNNLGVSVKQVYEVKQLDSDYFAEE